MEVDNFNSVADEINKATASRKDDITQFNAGVADLIKEYEAQFEPV